MEFEQKKTSNQNHCLHEPLLRVTTTMDLDLLMGFPCINRLKQFIRDLLFAMRIGKHNGCV